MALQPEYSRRVSELEPLLVRLVKDVEDFLLPDPLIDRIYGRVKSVEQFVAKAQKVIDGQPRYQDPLKEIQDQIGLRIIVKFDGERARIRQKMAGYLHPVEAAVKQPDEPDKFGYEATHLVCMIPADLVAEFHAPVNFLELQICTLFQHAWAEANHDVGYKPAGMLTRDQLRMKGLAAAHSWGADKMFQDLRDSLKN